MKRTLDGFPSSQAHDKSSSPPRIVNYDKNFQAEKKRNSNAEYDNAYDGKRKRGFTDSWLIDSHGLKKQTICVLA